MILAGQHRVLFSFCALFEVRLCSESMCALTGYTGTVTGYNASCSLQCQPPSPFLLPLLPIAFL